jgi:hypothetical protein
MSTVAAPVYKQIKSAKAQLYFNFVETRVAQSVLKRSAAPRPAKPAPVINTAAVDFKDMCLLLHGIAQKHVSKSDFESCTTLIRCAKLLANFGLNVETSAAMSAPAAEHDSALVTKDPRYRLMRNRAIACLATIADLSFKAPAKGSGEYQQGMRDAFQQASDIAVMFLEDIQNGV